MNIKKLFFLCIVFIISAINGVRAESIALTEATTYKYPYYMGVTFGYGSTTWSYLIASEPNKAITMSTPTQTKENGIAWGVLIGYEFLPTFALELSYDHYPQATVYFSEDSLFSFEHDGLLSFETNTETLSLMGKFMVIIPKNKNFRAFASAGAAIIHRQDILTDEKILSPKFNIGANFVLTPHLMLEFGIDYTSGYGESDLRPTNEFVPFLYSVFTRLVLRV